MTQIVDFWLRLRSRLRFGLATQEILDRMARLGVIIYPYVIMIEPMLRRPQADILPEGLRIRSLERHEAKLLASVPERPRDITQIQNLMQTAGCCAIVSGEELLAYGWFCRGQFRGMAGTNAFCRLPSDWAYLFDIYVRPVARGQQLAVHLRHHIQKKLADQGVKHCCSLSLVFNRSARRFKYKLGATDVELRVLLRLKPFNGLDVRLWRRAWSLQTPALRRVGLPD